MQTITGIPDPLLQHVLADIRREKLHVYSRSRSGAGAWTIAFGPAKGEAQSADFQKAGPDIVSEMQPPAIMPLPVHPPHPSFDQPGSPSADEPTRFVQARRVGPATMLFIDELSRESLRVGGSRSWRNCNPGNLRMGDFARNHGAIGDDGTFAAFASEKAGMSALIALLRTPSYSGLRLEEAIARYAPPHENDTSAYLAMLQQETGCGPGDILGKMRPHVLRRLATAIQKMEGWKAGAISSARDLHPAGHGLASSAAAAAREWMAIARREAALPEGARSEWSDPGENPRILEYFRIAAPWFEPSDGDEVAWCAAFVNFCLQEAGFKGTNHPGARSFFWNRQQQFVRLPGPAFGAIGVRRDPPFHDPLWSRGGGHVGFVETWSARQVVLLGGNQDNTVRQSTYELDPATTDSEEKSRFVAFLMPAIS